MTRTDSLERESPLDHLDETARHDGAEWFAEGPNGEVHLIRWFSNSGNVVVWRVTGMKAVHRGRAQSIGEARSEALRMAGLIADGRGADMGDEEAGGCPGCVPGGRESDHYPDCEFGPEAYKSHSAGCCCPDCGGICTAAGEA
jgi:hypothetical protein